ncbi:hypothetical protein QQS21_012482 [Conoideocrella luteorostrata]|uniref:Uncharacterized protein n=1 Tax=Conoideocrella luteorostrata TaxID=1105319 RepID=A0AAJ0FSF0_9HYPO|nr:hypothetical protein QQS21_012482 [Conoideocrella luteorostrata]
MPALTIPADNSTRSRSTSPVRPPMSPITPPLAPSRPPDIASAAGSLLPPMQQLSHSSQPSQQIGIPPPPPEPIDFELNPDVIALKSAISVLQVQKSRATADIQALNKVRDEALEEPEAFITDLAAGKVKPRDDIAFGTDDSDDEHGEGEDSKCSSRERNEKARAWSSLPRPQEVVRCPPINWAQYAVVGESLDKLHSEQVSRPSQGTPAVFGSNSLYDVRNEGKQEKYTGVAAPYTPGKDAVDRKAKGKK